MPIILKVKIGESRPILRGHDHYWSVIRRLGAEGATFTANDVSMDCEPGVEADIRDFVRRLCKAGIARRDDAGRVELLQRSMFTPRLARDGSENLQWRGRQQMWNVMRRHVGGFTARQVALDATTDDVVVTEPAARAYCKSLAKAGLLLEGRGSGRGLYRLTGSGNTGPKAPKVLASQLIYDENLRSIVGNEIEAAEIEP